MTILLWILAGSVALNAVLRLWTIYLDRKLNTLRQRADSLNVARYARRCQVATEDTREWTVEERRGEIGLVAVLCGPIPEPDEEPITVVPRARAEIAEARATALGKALRKIAASHEVDMAGEYGKHDQPISGHEARNIARAALSGEENVDA